MQLAIIVPCYNEEEVLPETARQLHTLVESLIKSEQIDNTSALYFVDDGSTDGTWKIIEELSVAHPSIQGMKLSRNYGHQNALLAGLFTAEGDAMITIDADLQDDVSVIEEMVRHYHQGSKIVYGVRRQRDSDSIFKRTTALVFYRMMRFLGVDIVSNHADFRLMSREVVEHLKQFKETNLFLRAMIPHMGFPSSCVYYDRTERLAGVTKYPLSKMLSFAWQGITSFSVVPLRIITVIGLLIFLSTLVMSAWALGITLFTDRAVPGWASTVLPIYFIGGIQVFAIGIIGEYIGKAYLETKSRPRFIIEKFTDNPP